MSQEEKRQLVRHLFFKLDPAWHRLNAEKQVDHKVELGDTIRGFQGRSLLRSYSLMGTRGDVDFMLWLATEDLETLQALETAIFSTRLGAYLTTPYSYLAMTKRSTLGLSQGGGKVFVGDGVAYIPVQPNFRRQNGGGFPDGRRF